MQARVIYKFSIAQISPRRFAVIQTSGNTEGSLSLWQIHSTHRNLYAATMECRNQIEKQKKAIAQNREP